MLKVGHHSTVHEHQHDAVAFCDVDMQAFSPLHSSDKQRVPLIRIIVYVHTHTHHVIDPTCGFPHLNIYVETVDMKFAT